MTEQDIARFRESPYYQDAVRLRQWDDRAKIPNMKTPDIEHFRMHLQAAARPKDQPE